MDYRILIVAFPVLLAVAWAFLHTGRIVAAQIHRLFEDRSRSRSRSRDRNCK